MSANWDPVAIEFGNVLVVENGGKFGGWFWVG